MRGSISPLLWVTTDRTCIILVEIDKSGTIGLMGIVVDSVSEVMQIAGDDIENPPDVGGDSTVYILGIAKKEGKVILLLDIDKVMNSNELAALESVG